MMLPTTDMRPPCSALASMGSISRSGRQRAISSRATPNTRPPISGTASAIKGSRRGSSDKRTSGPSRKSHRCSKSTPVPIAATTRPATTPVSAASAIRLDSRARTMARRRCGISSRLVSFSIKGVTCYRTSLTPYTGTLRPRAGSPDFGRPGAGTAADMSKLLAGWLRRLRKLRPSSARHPHKGRPAPTGAAPLPSAEIETDIPSRLDALPFGRFHLLVIVALGITWILDGLEVTLAGALSGELTQRSSLGLTSSQVGLAGSFISAAPFSAHLASAG